VSTLLFLSSVFTGGIYDMWTTTTGNFQLFKSPPPHRDFEKNIYNSKDCGSDDLLTLNECRNPLSLGDDAFRKQGIQKGFAS